MEQKPSTFDIKGSVAVLAPYIEEGQVWSLLRDGDVTRQEIRQLAEYIVFRSEVETYARSEDAVEEALRDKIARSETSRRAARLALHAMGKLFEPSEITAELATVLEEWPGEQRYGGCNGSPRSGTVAVPETELPESWQDIVTCLRRDGMTPDGRTLAGIVVKGAITTLRQFTGVLRHLQRPIEMTEENLLEYERYLLTKPKRIKYNSIVKYMMNIQVIARAMERDDLEDYIQDRVNLNTRYARREPRYRDERLAVAPRSDEIKRVARECLEESRSASTPAKARSLRNHAAAIMLVGLCPLRRSDWDAMCFGKNIFWNGGRYMLEKTTQKTDVDMTPELKTEATPFIDAIILHGRSPSRLEELRARCERDNRPVFVRRDGKPYDGSLVYKAFKIRLGMAPHDCRSLFHERLADFGSAGRRAALDYMDHSARTVDGSYTTRAARKKMERYAMDLFDDDDDEEDAD